MSNNNEMTIYDNRINPRIYLIPDNIKEIVNSNIERMSIDNIKDILYYPDMIYKIYRCPINTEYIATIFGNILYLDNDGNIICGDLSAITLYAKLFNISFKLGEMVPVSDKDFLNTTNQGTYFVYNANSFHDIKFEWFSPVPIYKSNIKRIFYYGTEIHETIRYNNLDDNTHNIVLSTDVLNVESYLQVQNIDSIRLRQFQNYIDDRIPWPIGQFTRIKVSNIKNLNHSIVTSDNKSH